MQWEQNLFVFCLMINKVVKKRGGGPMKKFALIAVIVPFTSSTIFLDFKSATRLPSMLLKMRLSVGK